MIKSSCKEAARHEEREKFSSTPRDPLWSEAQSQEKSSEIQEFGLFCIFLHLFHLFHLFGGKQEQAAAAAMADRVHKSNYAIPIPERKESTDWVRTIEFSILFNLLIISTNIAQFLFLALFYPLDATRPYYERSISYSKSVFSRLIVAISQLFAPTKLVISCSDENGKSLDPEKLVKRNSKGRIVNLQLPDRSVWISNHQVS